MRPVIIACMLGALASCTVPEGRAPPGGGTWSALPSPDRATISALDVGPTGNLYAGSDAGLFVSEDDGESWSVTTSVDWIVSSVLAVSDGTILVGTYRRGVWRSGDWGRTWSSVGFEGNVYVDALAQDSSGRVYAAVAHSVDDEATGIFSSDDDGVTWSSAGLGGEHAYSVTVIGHDSIYAGTGSGTYRSFDGGSSWTSVTGLPSFSAPLSALVKVGDTLIAGFAEPRHRAPGAGAWASVDGGRSWEQMAGLPAETAVHALWVAGDEVLAATGNVVGGGGTGLYRSSDALSWEPMALGGQWLRTLVGARSGQLFAGAAETGVFAGSVAGDDWAPRSTGLRNWNPTALTFGRDGSLYALSLRSMLRYEVGTRRWSEAASPSGRAAPTPFSFGTLSDGTFVMSGEGAILLQPEAPLGWERKDVPGVRGPAISIHVGRDDLVIATFPDDGSFVSRNRGESWVGINAPPGTRGVALSSAGTLLAFGDGVNRSTDAGAWESSGLEGSTVFSVVDCGAELYLGSAPEGVLRSRDDGRSWTPLMDELRGTAQQPGYIAVHSLLCLPDGGLVAATFSDGVFLLPKGGQWGDLNAGLPTRSVGDLAIGPDGSVYVVTSVGVYRSEQLPR